MNTDLNTRTVRISRPLAEGESYNWKVVYACDGTTHRVVRPFGYINSSSLTACDGSCKDWEEIPVLKIREALGILRAIPENRMVPEGWVAVIRHSHEMTISWSSQQAFDSGEQASMDAWLHGYFLAEGEHVDIEHLSHDRGGHAYWHTVRTRNIGGKAVDATHELSKEFAQQQIVWLMGRGYTQPQAYRIMKAAGPGQVRLAIEWLVAADAALMARQEGGEGYGIADALDMVLQGLGGRNAFGKDRIARALAALGLPMPEVPTANRQYGVLKGAHAALHNGYLGKLAAVTSEGAHPTTMALALAGASLTESGEGKRKAERPRPKQDRPSFHS